jgi:hypothetical protein
MRVCSVKICYRLGPTRHRFPNLCKYVQRFNEMLKLTGNTHVWTLARFVVCTLKVHKKFLANNKFTKEAIPSLQIPHGIQKVNAHFICNSKDHSNGDILISIDAS